MIPEADYQSHWN